jgi:hypothetical protein
MTKNEFKSPFMGLCELYDKTPSDALMSLYFETVKHLDAKTWNAAVRMVISSNKYPSLPKPAEILEATGQNEDKDAQAMLAMKKIEDAMRKHGAYQSMVFDDPVIHMLIDRHEGGWPGLCAMSNDELKWLWKDWVKMYKAYTVRPVRHSNRLVGVTEGQDEQLLDWQRAQMVSYIGDKAKCLHIEGNETKQIGGE